MQDLITLMVFAGLGVGVFSMATSLIFLIVAMYVSDKIRQRNLLVLAGKFMLAGLLLFTVGFGSCVLALNG